MTFFDAPETTATGPERHLAKPNKKTKALETEFPPQVPGVHYHPQNRGNRRPDPCLECAKSEGQRLKEKGQKIAVAAVDLGYRNEFEKAIQYLAAEKRPFTVDDVTELIGLPATGQNKNNSVGGLISGAASRGIIKRVGFSSAKRTDSHARTISSWIGV